MNAVGGCGEVDPCRAHRIVGTGCDREFALGLGAKGEPPGIVDVCWIGNDGFDRPFPARRRPLGAADRGRERRDDAPRRIEGAHLIGALVHFHARHGLPEVAIVGAEHNDRGADGGEIGLRIEFAQQRLAHVEFLGEIFERIGVTQMFELRHFGEVRRNFSEERTFLIIRGDHVILRESIMIGFGQRIEQRTIHIAAA